MKIDPTIMASCAMKARATVSDTFLQWNQCLRRGETRFLSNKLQNEMALIGVTCEKSFFTLQNWMDFVASTSLQCNIPEICAGMFLVADLEDICAELVDQALARIEIPKQCTMRGRPWAIKWNLHAIENMKYKFLHWPDLSMDDWILFPKNNPESFIEQVEIILREETEFGCWEKGSEGLFRAAESFRNVIVGETDAYDSVSMLWALSGTPVRRALFESAKNWMNRIVYKAVQDALNYHNVDMLYRTRGTRLDDIFRILNPNGIGLTNDDSSACIFHGKDVFVPVGKTMLRERVYVGTTKVSIGIDQEQDLSALKCE